VFTGVGWRGTGYKFAPWVGKVLAQLALQRGTVYDIGRFTPARFGGAMDEPLAGGWRHELGQLRAQAGGWAAPAAGSATLAMNSGSPVALSVTSMR
jgi:hypothetical protein